MMSFAYVGHLFDRVWPSTLAYAACVVLVYLIIARLHLRAASSPSVRDAQRKLRLLPMERFSCRKQADCAH